ncbi:hypothetical protein [Nitrosospira multiformis]|nr:hypothetical protein [Nitrosospira multiformis]
MFIPILSIEGNGSACVFVDSTPFIFINHITGKIIMNKDLMRNTGSLISPTIDISGGAIPDGYKVTRCNTDHIACMLWNPLGVWESTPNQVLKLVSSVCRLNVIKSNGLNMTFNFKENDYRYTLGNWIILIHQNDIDIKK